MDDFLEVMGMLLILVILLALLGLSAATIFAAPGYVVLLIAGHEEIGYWNSAAAGLGSIFLAGMAAVIIQAIRGK